MIKEISRGTELEYFINKNNYFTETVKKVYENTAGINNIKKYYNKGIIPVNHFKNFLIKFFNDVLKSYRWRCIKVNEIIDLYIENMGNNLLLNPLDWNFWSLYRNNFHLTFNHRNEFKKVCNHVLHRRLKNIHITDNDYKEFWNNIL